MINSLFSAFFKQKTPTLLWCKLLQCEDFILFSILYYCKLNISFGLLVRTNQQSDDITLDSTETHLITLYINTISKQMK